MLGSRKNKKVEKKVKKWQEDLDKDINTNDCEKVGIIEEQSNNNISLNTDENGLNKTEGEVEISHENKEQDLEQIDEQEGKKYDWMSSSDEVDNNPLSDEEEIIQKSEINQETKKNDQNLEHYDRRTIFISNINFEASDIEIKKFFEQFGSILNIEIPRNEGSSFNKGKAFIEYSLSQDAEKALKANGAYWNGNKISILQGLSKATSTLATAVIEKIKENEKEGMKKKKKSKKSRSRSKESRKSKEGKRKRSRSRSEKKKRTKNK